jgi:uncharacterized membrane protein
MKNNNYFNDDITDKVLDIVVAVLLLGSIAGIIFLFCRV